MELNVFKMQNIGEEIVGQYLKYCKHCEFVEYNINTTETQGEMDVVGINIENRQIFVCEVSVHLETGLQYTKNNKPDNINRLTNKFSKDIEYAKKYFPDFTIIAMFWSPIIKNTKEGSKYNQNFDLSQQEKIIKEKYDKKIIMVTNIEYMNALNELRNIESVTSQEMQYPI
jgi:hypothetical protein